MLKSLYIKNFIIIEKIKIDFSKGFNVIIGETGSGKSIILDALKLLTGERSSIENIRKGENKCVIEAKFTNNSNTIESLLETKKINLENEIILRRELNLKGNSRAFINDTPVSLNDLEEIAFELLMIHSQNENKFFNSSNSKYEFIDSLVIKKDLVESYKKSFSFLTLLINELKEKKLRKIELSRVLDYKMKELEEINLINIKENEEFEIENKLLVLENTELLLSICKHSNDLLDNNKESLIKNSYSILADLKQLLKFESKFDILINELNTTIITFKEIIFAINEMESSLEFSPVTIETLRLRLKEIKKLLKKYMTFDEIKNVKSQLEMDINFSSNFEFEINDLEEKILSNKIELETISDEIDKNRLEVIKNIEDQIIPILSNLGFEFVNFKIKFENLTKDDKLVEFNSKYYNNFGFRNIDFYLSTIKGESLKEMSSIASGGELSRIMLGLFSLLAFQNNKLLVFDEIDTGISGRISQKVGIEMSKIAKNSQIIAITHQAQISSLADKLFKVTKNTFDNFTNTTIEEIKETNYVFEIAHLISGENITENSMKNAQELINVKKTI
ncbi:MAG: AAA family ATPase [Candidatus Kapabacteria bacterium]|nr:AAA family ATPase [Candidatus Kapabacteria bacterium]